MCGYPARAVEDVPQGGACVRGDCEGVSGGRDGCREGGGGGGGSEGVCSLYY